MDISIEGQRIVHVRPMTDKETSDEGWDDSTTVLVLDNGVMLYASCDAEGNSAGVLFGMVEDNHFTVQL